MVEQCQIYGRWGLERAKARNLRHLIRQKTVLWQGLEATAISGCCFTWRAFTAVGANTEQRIAVIDRFTELLTENKENIALAIAQETGKSLWEARTSKAMLVLMSPNSLSERTGNNNYYDIDDGQRVLTSSAWVLAVFGLFNFPGHLPNGHIIPALLWEYGCFKPSELTPALLK